MYVRRTEVEQILMAATGKPSTNVKIILGHSIYPRYGEKEIAVMAAFPDGVTHEDLIENLRSLAEAIEQEVAFGPFIH